MKLTVTNLLSVDGVYQGPGSPNEDRSDGFERAGWLVPHFDDSTGQFMDDAFTGSTSMPAQPPGWRSRARARHPRA